MPRPHRFPRWSWPFAVALAVFAAGCAEDIIETHRQPRQHVRLLAAMVPQPDGVWVVKMTGSTDSIAENEAEFHQFLLGLRFTDSEKEPLTWNLPAGWQTEKSREPLRYATFRTSKNLEVAVSMVSGPMAADRLANVNRWRKQLGLANLKESELANVSRTTEIAGVKSATIVDMTGAQGMPIDFSPPKEPKAKPIEYKAPGGWTESKPRVTEQFGIFNVGEGKDAVNITITAFGGDAGGLVPNVNRWRGQVKLEPLEADALKKELREVKVADTPAHLLDVTGPKEDRVVGIICPKGGRTWFFKMTGPAAQVEKQRKAFDELIQSVRFAGEE